MRKSALVLLLWLTSLAAAAETVEVEQARVSDTPQYIAVMPGYFRADSGRGVGRKGVTASVMYGRRFSPHWGFELNLMGSTLETGGGQGTDFYQQGGTVDAVYDLWDRGAGWTPFALLGLGAVQNDVVPDSDDSVDFLVNAGLGLVSTPFTSWGIKLRGEGRYQYDTFKSGQSDLRFLAGVEIPFGNRRVELEPLAPPTVEIREVVKEVYVPVPFVDTDHDSIEDSRDKCPDTPQGLKVDADGCAIVGQALELRGVTFEFNKSTLQLNAQTVLDYVAKGMKGQPGMTVEIAGHTDSVGSAAANLKLSQRRAESVRTYLLGQGVDASRMASVGYGESQLLINPDTTPIDRERNRRVEFKVLSQ